MGSQAAAGRLRDPWKLFTLVCVALAAGLILLPLAQVLIRALADGRGGLNLNNLVQFISRRRYSAALVNSFFVVALSTGAAALLALPLAWLLSRYAAKGERIFLTLITMATAAPPFLGAYAWIMLLGRYGALNRAIFGLTGMDLNLRPIGAQGIIWVDIWLIFPLIFLLAYDAFCNEDPALLEASLSLGANRRRTVFGIEVPLAVPGIVTGLFMAALAAFSDFGTPAIIGGEYPVLPTLVYGEFVSEMGGNMSMASTAGLVMILVSTLALVGQRLLVARRTFSSVTSRSIHKRKAGPLLQAGLLGYLLLVVLFSFLPHLTLLTVSFMKWKWGILTQQATLANYARLFDKNLSPIGVSFFLGGISTLLVFVFGIGIAFVIVRKRYRLMASFMNVVFMVPYIIPGIVLAIGFIMQFNTPPVVLTGTWLILVISYFIRKLPYAVKSAESTLYQIHPALEEAALMCGARPFRAFRDVTFPLMRAGVISGVTLSFLQIMTELSSTIVLYRPPWITMPVVIFQNAMTSGADFGISAAMGVVLMVCIYVPLFLINRSTRGQLAGVPVAA